MFVVVCSYVRVRVRDLVMRPDDLAHASPAAGGEENLDYAHLKRDLYREQEENNSKRYIGPSRLD